MICMVEVWMRIQYVLFNHMMMLALLTEKQVQRLLEYRSVKDSFLILRFYICVLFHILGGLVAMMLVYLCGNVSRRCLESCGATPRIMVLACMPMCGSLVAG